MRKKSLLFSALLLATNLLYAQDNTTTDNHTGIDQKKVRFGAYVAPTLSWMQPANPKSNDGAYKVTNNGSKVGFTWGLMMDYWFAKNYAIATGLQVNGTGGKIRATHIDPTQNPNKVMSADFNYSFQYFEIPANLKLRTAPLFKGISFFGQAGITAGINIGKRASYEVAAVDGFYHLDTYSGTKEKISGTLSIAPVMFQLNLGIGAQYPISGKLKAYVGVFFNNGFAPDATNPSKYNLGYPGNFSDGNVRLNNFALRVGLFF